MAVVDYIKTFRPAHWVKNLLVGAPLFFSGGMLDAGSAAVAAAAFAGFCFASGFIYVVNDLVDVGQDRADAVKRNRPYAAGRISRGGMMAAASGAAVAAGAVAACIGDGYALMLAAYAVLMLSYNFFLKKMRAAGVVAIAAGMILRMLAGAAAIDVRVSAWVYPEAFLLAAYVVAGKRIYMDAAVARPSAAEELLFRALGAATVAVYAAYSFSGVGVEKYGTSFLWVTAPFVALAVWRYYSLARRADRTREHLQAILSDPAIVSAVFAWLAVFAALIYGPQLVKHI